MTLFAEVRHVSSARSPLVLLHGFGGIGAAWQPVIERLDHDQPLVIYDLPGHGRSLDAQSIGHAGVMAKVILDDLDRRGLTRFHLCGHSMGGAVACLIALRARDCVISLTLAAPGGFGAEINHQALRRYGCAVTVDELRLTLASMLAPGRSPDPAELEMLAEARRLPGAADRLMQILKSFLVERDGHLGQGVLPLAAFEGLGVPTRLLWGQSDPVLPDAQAGAIWSGAEVSLIAGAGHMLIEEAPDAVAAAITAALAEN